MGYNRNMSRLSVGYNPFIQTIDPNFQRDIQVSHCHFFHRGAQGRSSLLDTCVIPALQRGSMGGPITVFGPEDQLETLGNFPFWFEIGKRCFSATFHIKKKKQSFQTTAGALPWTLPKHWKTIRFHQGS